MKVRELYTLFLRDMGYSRSDAEESDVQEEYKDNALRWLNEAYSRAVLRLRGSIAAEDLEYLSGDEDEPFALSENLHGYLADYAAARGQEMRGNGSAAAGLYAAFERAVTEAGREKDISFSAWRKM